MKAPAATTASASTAVTTRQSSAAAECERLELELDVVVGLVGGNGKVTVELCVMHRSYS